MSRNFYASGVLMMLVTTILNAGELPDPFVFADGRAELRKLVMQFEYGELPPAPAIVKTEQGGVLTVSRNGEADREVPHARVIGRVLANTR